MELFLASLSLFACAALILGPLALVEAASLKGDTIGRFANYAGPIILALACALGFGGAIMGLWAGEGASSALRLPWALPFGEFVISLTSLSRVFLLPVFGLGFVCAASGCLALRHDRGSAHNLAAHWFFYALLMLGMALVLSARDAILFLLSWELMSLAPFFLIDYNDDEARTRDAAWVYLTAAHLGAILLIAFFTLLWQTTGQTFLEPATIRESLEDASPVLRNSLFILAVLGFGAKAGSAPMHVWLPEAHPAAPSHISALLSGAMINLGIYGIILSITLIIRPPGTTGLLGPFPAWWGWFLLFLGIATALLGVLKALGQRNMKRLLAYSTVENAGLMLSALGVGLLGLRYGEAWIALAGCAGCILHMLNHAGFKGLLFLLAGEILHATGTVRMDLLGGLCKKLPATSAFFAIGAASIACLPPFSGFTGEFLLCVALAYGAILPGVESQLGVLLSLGVVALVSGLACALYIKTFGMTFLGLPRSGFSENAHAPEPLSLAPLTIPLCACIAGGLLAPIFFAVAADAALASFPFPDILAKAVAEARTTLDSAFFHISLYGACIIPPVIGLIWARRLLLRGRNPQIHTTWACGFQAGTARIQYSEASFSEPLVRLFNSIVGVKQRYDSTSGIFPQPAFFAISAPDRIKNKIIAPVFSLVENWANACKIIQHGKIHLYILYIVAALIGVLLWSFGS